MIKGKRKTLSPDENLDSIIKANTGFPAWRIKVKRPRRRVTIAYYWGKDDDGNDVWAEFQWRKGLIRNQYGEIKVGERVTYNRQHDKPRAGFISDGKEYQIQIPRTGLIVRTSYDIEKERKRPEVITVPDDIVKAFREVWKIEIDRVLVDQAYQKWKAANLSQSPQAQPK